MQESKDIGANDGKQESKKMTIRETIIREMITLKTGKIKSKKIDRGRTHCNRKKGLCSLAAAALLSCILPLSSLAGAWQQNEKGWWWQNNDGSYPSGRWVLLDGNMDGTAEYYYFNRDGYLLTDTQTPDYRTVNADGALIRSGQTVTRSVFQYDPKGAVKPASYLETELPLSLLGLSVEELQARYGSEVRLTDKADSLEYLEIDGLSGYEFIVRRGTVKKIITTPDKVLTNFEDTRNVRRMEVLLGAAGFFTDENTDFMLKSYYNGCEFLFEYHDEGGVDSDSRVSISLDEP